MEFLPQEIVNEILLVVDKPTLYQASLVYKQWRLLSLKQIKIIKTYKNFDSCCNQGDRLSIINCKINRSWINYGLSGASLGGQKDLVEYIIAKGAE